MSSARSGQSSPQATTGFAHQPLDTTVQSIRVLKILPRPKGEKKPSIECTLQHQILTEDGHVCLSYMWGPENPVKTISLNGQSFRIRQNLWRFLRTARRLKTFEGVWLWIDAICIDQQNFSERNHQVQLMAEIYRRARKVTIWPEPTHFSPHTSLYWNRLWTLQEILLAKHLEIIIGGTTSSWSKFSTMGPSSTFTAEMIPLIDIISALEGGDRRGHRDPRLRLDTALQLVKNRECGEVRDRFYGLLGLTKSTKFPVDYSIALPVLVTNVAIHFFHHSFMEEFEGMKALMESFNVRWTSRCDGCTEARAGSKNFQQQRESKHYGDAEWILRPFFFHLRFYEKVFSRVAAEYDVLTCAACGWKLGEHMFPKNLLSVQRAGPAWLLVEPKRWDEMESTQQGEVVERHRKEFRMNGGWI